MKRFIFLLLGCILVSSTPLMGVSHSALASENAEVMTEAVQQSTMLLQLKQKLAQAQYRYYLLQNNVQHATEGLQEIQDLVLHLEATLDNLDAQLQDAHKKVLSVKSQKEQKKMDLKALEDEVVLLELQLEDQKAVVSELMTLLYVKRGVYYENNSINTVKVLASPQSVSETLQSLTYLDMIEAANQSEVKKMVELSTELTQKWQSIHQKQEDLDTLDEQLASEVERLQAERDAQADLLEETQLEASIFEAMLASSDENEAELLKEIEIYEKNVKLMDSNYSSTQILLSSEERELIEKIEQDMSEQFSAEEAANFLDLDWPVPPGAGLTAFFHDDGYRSAFGVDHNALDIRANHGSLIHAPADGVVSDVIFDPSSTRYAYIVIQHRKGVSTLVGHVSDVAVQVGDFVQRGMVIGATGATPGSVGAGVRTTGPHLHFEVWQDGVRVDPLLYLPLEEVPKDSLPASYIQLMQQQLEADLRNIQQQLLD